MKEKNGKKHIEVAFCKNGSCAAAGFPDQSAIDKIKRTKKYQKIKLKFVFCCCCCGCHFIHLNGKASCL